jgi:endonuclease/exonuclease/phosphatase family metal-dependent hydrolase
MTEPKSTGSSRWKAVAIALAFILIGLVVWDGSDRKAADATKALAHGSVSVPLKQAPTTLKLASFNIHSGKGTDGVRNLPRTSDLLSDIDFVGLYEVRAIAEAGQPNQAAMLGYLQNAAWVFAPAERQWWSDHFRNGLLYRIPVRSIVRIPLVNTRGKAFRNAILSTAELEGTDVRVISVHIDRENDRRHQLQSVIDLFLGLQPPCVLMGDLNTSDTDPLLIRLRERSDVKSPLHDALSGGPPSQTIDWIFTRGLETVSASVEVNTASDHPCVKAELKLMEMEAP